MAGKTRPSLLKKTLKNVETSALSNTDKECIKNVFEEFSKVVRCKDCAHYIDGRCYVTNRSPLFKYNVNIHSRKEDDFCSYGERKE